MKRFFNKTLALTLSSMLIVGAFTACSGSANVDVSVNGGGQSASSGDVEDPGVPVVEDEPALPDNLTPVEFKNEAAGYEVTVGIPKGEYEWTIEDMGIETVATNNRPQDKRIRIESKKDELYNAAEITFSTSLSTQTEPNTNLSSEQDLVDGCKYAGYVVGSKDDKNVRRTVKLFTEPYLDGCVQIEVQVAANSVIKPEDMDGVFDDILGSINVKTTAEETLLADDGSFKSWVAPLTYPADIKIDGNDTDVQLKVNRLPILEAAFDVDSTSYKVRESARVANANDFTQYAEKDGGFTTKVGDYEASAYIYNEIGTLYGQYTVKFDEDTYGAFTVVEVGELDVSTIKEMLNGVEREGLQEKYTGFLSDFIGSAAVTE